MSVLAGHLDPEDLDTEDLDTEDLDTEDLDTEDLDTEDLDTEDMAVIRIDDLWAEVHTAVPGVMVIHSFGGVTHTIMTQSDAIHRLIVAVVSAMNSAFANIYRLRITLSNVATSLAHE